MSITRKHLVRHAPKYSLTEWPPCFCSRGTLVARMYGEDVTLDWFGDFHQTPADILERYNFRPSSIAFYSFDAYSLIVQCKSGYSWRFQLL